MRWGGALLWVVVGSASGCQRCEELEARFCKDLEEDCAIWKEIGGPDQALPPERENRACGQLAESDVSYQGRLIGAKALVLAEKSDRAMRRGDRAEAERLDAAYEKLKRQALELNRAPQPR